MNKALYHVFVGTIIVLALSSASSAHAETRLPIPLPLPEIRWQDTHHKLTLPTSIKVDGTTLKNTLIQDLLTALHASCESTDPATSTLPTSPAPTTTPATMTFIVSPYNQWEFTAGFNHSTAWSAYLNPNSPTTNDRGAALSADPVSTDFPTSLPIEAFIADTKGQYLVDRCGQPAYTGNATSDLSCYVNEAIAQGYPYVLGQHAAVNN